MPGQAGRLRPAATSGAAVWWLALRPRTLVASLAPVVVGLAVAARGGPIAPGVALATALCALLLQIATNLANDYYDHLHGIDTGERLGPLRVTQAGLLSPASVRRAMIAALAVAAVLGLWLVWIGGWPIALIGAVSIAGALAYSAGPWPLASYGFGDAMAFVFFGVIAVNGTFYLQRHAIDAASFLASLPMAMLITAILVVNNLRDIPTDRASGKRTLAVRIGDRATRIEYACLLGGAFLLTGALARLVGAGAFLSWLVLPLAARELRALWQRQGPALNASLAGTARLQALFGLLLALGLLL